MKTLQSWGNEIANETQLAASMPKWYAHVAVVNLDKAKTDDGYLDMRNAPTYSIGDQLMFITCGDDFETSLNEDGGKVYTITEVTGDNKVKFEQGEVQGTGLYFAILFLKNSGFDVASLETTGDTLAKDERIAMVPVTIEMLLADEKSETHPLRSLGLKCPGWYSWAQFKRVRESGAPESYKTIARLLVSMKGFHSPDGSAGDVGETFQPGEDGDSEIDFDQQGEITLG